MRRTSCASIRKRIAERYAADELRIDQKAIAATLVKRRGSVAVAVLAMKILAAGLEAPRRII